MNWISVTARLPAYDEEVLVTCGKEIAICRRDFTDKEGEHWTEIEGGEFHDATHWMPLPPLPTPMEMLEARG